MVRVIATASLAASAKRKFVPLTERHHRVPAVKVLETTDAAAAGVDSLRAT